jgi:hypothetical protein
LALSSAGGLPPSFWLVFWLSVALIGFVVVMGLLYRMRNRL